MKKRLLNEKPNQNIDGNVVARVFRRGDFLAIGNQTLASEEANYKSTHKFSVISHIF